MIKNRELTQEQFDALLSWLSEDREKAGEKYEEIRTSLIRLFELKGCNDPQTLTDATFCRFTSKIETLELNNNLKPISILYGFAKNIYLESLREKETQLDVDAHDLADKKMADCSENKYLEFLQDCLGKLNKNERQLVLEYYAKDKTAKILERKEIAKKNNLAIGTMHTKVHRIRQTLQKCIENKIKL